MKPLSVLSLILALASLSCVDDRTFSNPVDPTVPLDSPTNVASTALADTAVQVLWTHSGSATSFEIEEKIGTGEFTQIGSVPASSRAYVRSFALQGGQSYTYGVRAVNSDNRSTYATANAVAVTFGPPTAVTVAAVADTAVDVSWTYTGAFQTGFEIERQVGAGAFSKVMTVGSSTRTWRDQLLMSDGNSYAWRVRAVSKNNQSSYGSAPAFSASLAAPSSLAVTLTLAQASLSWTDNSTIERGFSIEQSSDGTNFAVAATAPANAAACTINGSFTAGTTYYFRVRAYASVNGPYSNIAATVPLGMVAVAGGTYQMGSTTGNADETPVHSVTVGSFNMDKYEITYEKWTAVRTWGSTHGYTDLPAGQAGSAGTGTNQPVTVVNWYDIVKWCNARSEMDGLAPVYYTDGSQTTIYKTGTIDLVNGAVKLTAHGYRLPTEAEWEFAARGGTQTHGYAYSGSNDINTVAWYSTNSGTNTHPVGGLAANELGLYDMSGNVWEWCWDWYGGYSSSVQTNPQGPASGTYRVLRGGSSVSYAFYCRVSYRNGGSPGDRVNYFGFRCVQD